jgi:hypothetical protein
MSGSLPDISSAMGFKFSALLFVDLMPEYPLIQLFECWLTVDGRAVQGHGAAADHVALVYECGQ